MSSSFLRYVLLGGALAVLASTAVVHGASDPEDPLLSIGEFAVVDRDEADLPYSYTYYIPHSAFEREITAVVVVVPGGGKDRVYEDAIATSRFVVRYYLHYKNLFPRPKNLSEATGLIFFSAAVPNPFPEVCEDWGLQDSDTSYARALDYNSLTVAAGDFFRPDLKYLEVFDSFLSELEKLGLVVDPRMLLTGGSAGAGWTHRFAMLHPERVRAAAPSGTSLWTMPLMEYGGSSLPYPLGIGGLEEHGIRVDLEAFKRIPFLIHMGIDDNKIPQDMLAFLRTGEDVTIAGATVEEARAYADSFGKLGPQRAESYHEQLLLLGMEATLFLCNTGHGMGNCYTEPRIMEFFNALTLSPSGWD